MRNKIEIHDNNTNETGTYKIWYTLNGDKMCCTLSENYVNSLLSMRQKEDFLTGQYKFYIGDYDFKSIVVNGIERGGLGSIKRTQL